MWFWGILCILAIIIEAMTVNLVSVWFAAGAFAALLSVALFHLPLMMQWIIFFVVSAAALLLFRTKMIQKFNHEIIPTNADMIIGKEGVVQEKISNLDATGRIRVCGQDWAARATDETREFAPGEKVVVIRIEGVKAIVKEGGKESC